MIFPGYAPVHRCKIVLLMSFLKIEMTENRFLFVSDKALFKISDTRTLSSNGDLDMASENWSLMNSYYRM